VKLVRPLPHEVWVREADGRPFVIHTFSPRQAEQIRAKLEAKGQEPSVYVGNLEVRR
jgi:hypothetical protein